MSPDAQRIAIAETCGWKRDYLDEDSGFRRDFWRNPANTCDIWSNPPNYPNDLNAMHEAESILTDDQYKLFALHLGPLTSQRTRAYISATAAQRAEAFLRTLNLWDDTK